MAERFYLDENNDVRDRQNPDVMTPAKREALGLRIASALNSGEVDPKVYMWAPITKE